MKIEQYTVVVTNHEQFLNVLKYIDENERKKGNPKIKQSHFDWEPGGYPYYIGYLENGHYYYNGSMCWDSQPKISYPEFEGMFLQQQNPPYQYLIDSTYFFNLSIEALERYLNRDLGFDIYESIPGNLAEEKARFIRNEQKVKQIEAKHPLEEKYPRVRKEFLVTYEDPFKEDEDSVVKLKIRNKKKALKVLDL